MAVMNHKVLVLDQSSTITGYAVVDLNKKSLAKALLDSGFIKLKGKDWQDRVKLLGIEVTRQMDIVKPKAIAIEDTLYIRQRRPEVGQIFGAISYVLWQIAQHFNVELIKQHPSEVKKVATGNGKADKTQVCMEVTKLYSLPFYPQEDQGDALAGAYKLWVENNKGENNGKS
jgi:crossover junction endodeoxyribonuclease RuvC